VNDKDKGEGEDKEDKGKRFLNNLAWLHLFIGFGGMRN
jgi:hypothetical protein